MIVLRNLDQPPTPNYLHYLQADYIEFVCLTCPDKSIGRNEIRSMFTSNADINIDNEYNELSREVPDNSDKQLLRTYEWFQYMKHREEVLCGSYPFSINGNFTELVLKQELNDHHKLYVYLLMASCLRHFDKQASFQLSSSFEVVCAEALRQYVGNSAVVKIFGKGPHAQYSGSKYARLTQLAADLCESVRVPENRFEPTDTGDEGLDVVGWFDTRDCSPGRLLIFGQCACGDDWVEKQQSIDFNKWRKLITLSGEPVRTVFIPYFFRDSSGNWYADDQISTTLMIDRLRLMKLLGTLESPLLSLPPEVLKIVHETTCLREID